MRLAALLAVDEDNNIGHLQANLLAQGVSAHAGGPRAAPCLQRRHGLQDGGAAGDEVLHNLERSAEGV